MFTQFTKYEVLCYKKEHRIEKWKRTTGVV